MRLHEITREPPAFLEVLPEVCEHAQAGLHFEEGGCWGMALALDDALRADGLAPQIVVMPGHAMVRANGKLYDHMGEVVARGLRGLREVDRAGLLAAAEDAGWTRDEVEGDRDWAAELIASARELAAERAG